MQILIRILAICLLTFSVCEQVYAEEKIDRRQEGWNYRAGVFPVYAPAFLGSKDYVLSMFPDLRIGYGDKFFASVPEGVGYNLINESGWKIGPLAKIRFSRNEENGGSPFQIAGESKALRGMGNVDLAVENGIFAQYQFSKFRSRLEIRRGFGGHSSLIGDLNISYVDRVGPISFNFGPKTTFGGRNFIQTYYGINQRQHNATGLDQYRADGGIVSYGFGGSAIIPLNQKTALNFLFSYDRLGNELTKSPLIEQRGRNQQFTVGLGYSKRFSTN